MNRKSSLIAVLAVSLLLISTAALAVDYRADRISSQGQITSIARSGDIYTIGLNHGTYLYYVPAPVLGGRGIRMGDQVRIGGVVTGNTVNADYIALLGEPGYRTDPLYQTVPFGSSGWMSGTVTRLHQHYHYIDLRDDATGQIVKIDVRNMDEKRSVNVWRTRPGDHINVFGSWANRDTFEANLVQY